MHPTTTTDGGQGRVAHRVQHAEPEEQHQHEAGPHGRPGAHGVRGDAVCRGGRAGGAGGVPGGPGAPGGHGGAQPRQLCGVQEGVPGPAGEEQGRGAGWGGAGAEVRRATETEKCGVGLECQGLHGVAWRIVVPDVMPDVWPPGWGIVLGPKPDWIKS